MRLIQIMGDGIEELWNFPNHYTDEMIQSLYKEYIGSVEEYFEQFITGKGIEAERIFVDEIYV